MQDFINELNKVLLSSPLYWIVTVSSFLVIFVCIRYGNKIVGWFGEHWSRKSLSNLDKSKYIVLNDIMFLLNDKTYQIDHIVVSVYGIFVIETKQYNGYITGSKYDKQWVRHLKGGKKLYYYNPIRQNYGHVKAVCELLNLTEDKVFNIVCIPSNAKLNIQDDGEIARMYNLDKKIISYQKRIIENIDEIKNIIISNNIVDKNLRKKHVEQVNVNKVEYDSNTCPKCGNKLVERNGKYGKFIGCSNYPKCKYTRKNKGN